MLKTITPIITVLPHNSALYPICRPSKPLAFKHCASPFSLLQETILQFKPLGPPIIIAPENMHKAIDQQCKDMKAKPIALLTKTAEIKHHLADHQIPVECPCGFLIKNPAAFIKALLQSKEIILPAEAHYIDSKWSYFLLWSKRKFFSAQNIEKTDRKPKKL